jgi:hypothetical protein
MAWHGMRGRYNSYSVPEFTKLSFITLSLRMRFFLRWFNFGFTGFDDFTGFTGFLYRLRSDSFRFVPSASSASLASLAFPLLALASLLPLPLPHATLPPCLIR